MPTALRASAPRTPWERAAPPSTRWWRAIWPRCSSAATPSSLRTSGRPCGGRSTTAVGGGAQGLAMSAVDIALWDLRARRQGAPLWRVLGGFDPRVPCYAGGIDLDFSLDALLRQTDENLALPCDQDEGRTAVAPRRRRARGRHAAP